MPYLARAACSNPTCPNRKPCPIHGRTYRVNVHPYAWRAKSKRYLANNPDCVMCGGLATEVDHIVPSRFGGSDDESNLRALCKSDHSRVTAKTFRFGAQ